MELTLEQRRELLDRVAAWAAWADAPAGTKAGIAWGMVENYVVSLVQEGEGERNRLAERCEMLLGMYDNASEERERLRERLQTAVMDGYEMAKDEYRDRLIAAEAEVDDLRNRLELIETACTAHRVKRADWHAQAAEELARAEVSTAGHGDLHDGGAR